MTTHVFIVDETTFPYHLQYLFAGTGAGDKDVDFNNSPDSSLYSWKQYATENNLVAMMADCCRIRNGDHILFYLQATQRQEGLFFGVFKAVGDPFLDKISNPQFLHHQLGKSLTFRVRIEPYQVYAEGVTEWKALDEIRYLSSPHQMLWSLIYRKLKGNRGNTMITVYESERLIDLIRRKNNYSCLPLSPSYQYRDGRIYPSETTYSYPSIREPFNILPRLIKKHNLNKSYEAHLQMFITQNIGRNSILDDALGLSRCSIEWLGNEVSCGVGMQRIDVLLSKVVDPTQRVVMPIELKTVKASLENLCQINKYIDWIEQYYIPNRISTIQPVLLCKAGGLTQSMTQSILDFNNAAHGRHLPLRYVEYTVKGTTIVFTNIVY